MTAENVPAFTRRRPFLPYRIPVTGGQAYDVRHPDQVIVLRSRIVIGVGGENGVPDHIEHILLVHIVRIEQLDSKCP